MDRAIIIGAGTYGQVYAEYLNDTGKYNIIGFLDDDVSKHNQLISGFKVLGNVNHLEEMQDKSHISVFVPIGNNEIRIKILSKVQSLNFKTPCFIHASVNIHHTVSIGKCVYILPSSSIMPHSVIEDFVMISMGVNVAHHTFLRMGSFLSQGVNVGASINIGNKAFLGIASTIMTGIKSIGENTTIGAGSVIIRDVPDNAIVVGNPGKIIKYNNNYSKVET